MLTGPADPGDHAPVEATEPGWSPRYGVAVVAVTIFAQAYGINAVVPLFPLYQDQLGLSTGQLTIVYGSYATLLVPTLALLGAASDRLGRKRVMVPALVLSGIASLVFVLATSLGWLAVARALQGVANGVFIGATAAFVRDLTPDHRRQDASLIVSTAFPTSVAIGVLVTGLLGSVTDSTVTPWLVHVGLVIVAAALLTTVPESRPADVTVSGRLTIRLPRHHRRDFVTFLAPVTFGQVALAAITMALTPAMLVEIGVSSAAGIAGAALAILVVSSSIVQPLSRRVGAYPTTLVGTTASVLAGPVLCVAVALRIAPLLFVGLALMGGGVGLAFKGTLALAELMSLPEDRAAVISAYNVVMYSGFALPTFAAGFLADGIGVAWSLAVSSLACTAVIAVAFRGSGLQEPLRRATPHAARA